MDQERYPSPHCLDCRTATTERNRSHIEIDVFLQQRPPDAVGALDMDEPVIWEPDRGDPGSDGLQEVLRERADMDVCSPGSAEQHRDGISVTVGISLPFHV